VIARPGNLDLAHQARVIDLLDAFIAIGRGSLMLHESAIRHLPYIVWSWATARCIKISVCPMVRCDGTAYESWDIGPFGEQIHIFPNEVGLLAPNADRLKSQIAEIQRDAVERIKALTEVSK
jgi:hypothetical protein